MVDNPARARKMRRASGGRGREGIAGTRCFWRLNFAAYAIACLLFLAPASADEKRVALLIGNQAYLAAVGPLKSPHKDIEFVGSLKTASSDTASIQASRLLRSCRSVGMT